MAPSAIASVAENVLAAFIAKATKTGTTSSTFDALDVPTSLRVRAPQLTPLDLATVLVNARRNLADLSVNAAQLDAANPLSLFHGAAATSSNPAAVTSHVVAFFVGQYANLRPTFLATTATPVIVAVKPHVPRLTNAIGALADAYNASRTLFDTYTDLNPDVSGHLDSVAQRLRADLQDIGIQLDGSGTFAVSSSDVSDALAQRYGTVRRVIADAHGLAPDLRTIADTMLARPAVQLAPVPGYQAGYAPQLFTGWFASRRDQLRLTGLLVDALG